MTTTFSEQFKKIRRHQDLSQEEIANKLFISRETISQWENDEATPNLSQLVQLSRLFDVSLDELVLNDSSHHRHDEHPTNFWQFAESYWWLIFPIGGFLSWFIPHIIEVIKQ